MDSSFSKQQLGGGSITPNNNNRARIVIIYPTVSPEVVIIPIVSSIFVFPILVLLIICWLRKMAAKRRQRARLAHKDDFWNERSCASIVQRSPPLSISGAGGNGCSGSARFGTLVDPEMATTTLEIEMVQVEQICSSGRIAPLETCIDIIETHTNNNNVEFNHIAEVGGEG